MELASQGGTHLSARIPLGLLLSLAAGNEVYVGSRAFDGLMKTQNVAIGSGEV